VFSVIWELSIFLLFTSAPSWRKDNFNPSYLSFLNIQTDILTK
jgi:hypothetical protein